MKKARSAISGKFVTVSYAKAHPETTVVENIYYKKTKRK